MIVPGLYPYTNYTNYTDYTPYTRYTANLEKSTGIEIPVWLIRKFYKRSRPMMQAQSCNPAETGRKRQKWPKMHKK